MSIGPLERLTIIIDNAKDDSLTSEELAQTIIDYGFIDLYGNIGEQIVRYLADRADELDHNADICESAAHVEGETGRQEVIERRDWMHEDPGQWMRDMADWIIKEDGE
ncbi:hypothetical protein VR010_15045 [Actinomycetaceae bacterium L2_0104]